MDALHDMVAERVAACVWEADDRQYCRRYLRLLEAEGRAPAPAAADPRRAALHARFVRVASDREAELASDLAQAEAGDGYA